MRHRYEPPMRTAWCATALLTVMACGNPAEEEVEDSPPAAIECDLPSIAAAIAGEQAIACGLFEVGEEPDRCAEDALASAQAYWVVTESAGIDSVLSVAWIYDGARLFQLIQDDYNGENARVEGVECVGPPADGVPTCDPLAPADNSFLVCGRVCDGCSGPMPLLFEHEAVECAVEEDDSLACTVD